MLWVYVVLGIVVGVVVFGLVLYGLSKKLEGKEPYGSFLRLRTRNKIRFFQRLIADPRVPKRAKAIPFVLAVYLALPFDLIPDFIPVLGYLDDVAIALGAFALIIRWTPRKVIDELLLELAQPAP